MPRLLLVRHAQSENNLATDELWKKHHDDPERYNSELERALKPDPDLSATGRAQAEALAEALGPLLAEARDRALLVSSPMRRVLQTATPLAARAELDRDRFLCHAELFEVGSRLYGKDAPPSELATRLEAEYPLRCYEVPSDASYSGDGRESSDDARARVERVVAWTDATLARGEHRLVVMIAHGHLLTRCLRLWLGVPWNRGMAIVHANTGISMLDWDRHDGVVLEFTNDIGHVPAELQTGGTGNWWGYALPDLKIKRYEARADIPEAIAAELAELCRLLPATAVASDDATDSIHFVAQAEGEIAGYVELELELETGRLRQLIVSPSRRRARLGRRLVTKVVREAFIEACEEIVVHAPLDNVDFFGALGFETRGEVQGDEGRRWREMVKALPSW
jgi:2,3-bisphosphoglycerate-dependent phosphoglycerate mutase